MKNYYKILEIDQKASQEEIKKQYKFLMNVWHPDKFTAEDYKNKVTEKVIELNEAYGILSIPGKRESYDQQLKSYLDQQENSTIKNDSNSTKYENSRENYNSVDQSPVGYCECCGMLSETKYIHFCENKGFIVMRSYKSVKGNLCRYCINYFFWNMTGVTFLLGWWGLISAIVTPFILLNNIFRYLSSFGISAPLIKRITDPSPFWILSTIVGISLSLFFGIALISGINTQTASSDTSTSNIQPTNKPTNKPSNTPTNTVITQSQDFYGCIPWSDVTIKMVGEKKCITGKVYDSSFISSSTYRIYFSKNSSFYLESDPYYYDVPDGECVIAEGKIILSTAGVPYMNINDSLYTCD